MKKASEHARSYVAGLKPGAAVTLDVDAHLVETAKEEARVCYDGYQAYQALLVEWAEDAPQHTQFLNSTRVTPSAEKTARVDWSYSRPVACRLQPG